MTRQMTFSAPELLAQDEYARSELHSYLRELIGGGMPRELREGEDLQLLGVILQEFPHRQQFSALRMLLTHHTLNEKPLYLMARRERLAGSPELTGLLLKQPCLQPEALWSVLRWALRDVTQVEEHPLWRSGALPPEESRTVHALGQAWGHGEHDTFLDMAKSALLLSPEHQEILRGLLRDLASSSPGGVSAETYAGTIHALMEIAQRV